MEHRKQGTPFSATERDRVGEEGAQLADNVAHRTQETGDKVSDKVSDMAHQAADRVQQVADDLRHKDPAEIAGDVRAKASELVDTTRQRASEAGAVAADKVDDAMTATGEQMTNLAQTVRAKAPHEGRAGEIATNTAEALERGGQYLKDADLQVVRSDLERIIREHPVEAMLVGLGLGYMLARVTRR